MIFSSLIIRWKSSCDFIWHSYYISFYDTLHHIIIFLHFKVTLSSFFFLLLFFYFFFSFMLSFIFDFKLFTVNLLILLTVLHRIMSYYVVLLGSETPNTPGNRANEGDSWNLSENDLLPPPNMLVSSISISMNVLWLFVIYLFILFFFYLSIC